jgi:hypothetical protein
MSRPDGQPYAAEQEQQQVVLDEYTRKMREREAGAYTRLIFSSTRAVSDTHKHPTHHKHLLTPP